MIRTFPKFGYNPVTGEWNDSLTGEFLWSNVNLSEAVPDVMTPSTWSLWWIFHYETNPIVLPGNYPFCGNIAGRPYFNLSLLFSVYQAVGQDVTQHDAGIASTNAAGSLTNATARLAVIEPVITLQPTNQLAELHGTASFSVEAAGTTLQYRWLKAGSPLPNETNAHF